MHAALIGSQRRGQRNGGPGRTRLWINSEKVDFRALTTPLSYKACPTPADRARRSRPATPGVRQPLYGAFVVKNVCRAVHIFSSSVFLAFKVGFRASPRLISRAARAGTAKGGHDSALTRRARSCSYRTRQSASCCRDDDRRRSPLLGTITARNLVFGRPLSWLWKGYPLDQPEKGSLS